MKNPYGLSGEQLANVKKEKLEGEVTNTELRFAVKENGLREIVLQGEEAPVSNRSPSQAWMPDDFSE